MSFFITVYNITDEQAYKLWSDHKTDKIHCLAFEGKAHINGEADKAAVEAIIADIKALGKEYGIVSEELM